MAGRTQSGVLEHLGVSYPQLIDYASKGNTATLVQICTLVLIIWDCITTFDGEMAFFWQAKRQLRLSPARVLFMLNRYFSIIAFSLHVYWRVNRSLENPLWVKSFGSSIHIALTMIKMHHEEAHGLYYNFLQILRVWSVYHRSRSIGLFLLAVFVCGAIGSILGRTLQVPKGLPLAQLAPESLTGCGRERPEGIFECTSGLIVETVFLVMIILKVRSSWTHVGALPLFRALILDGATYYFVLALTFSLNIVATMNNKLYYPIVDTNFIICVNVVACNHLMLSLIEAGGRPTSVEPLSYSLTQPTTSDVLATRASNLTNTHVNRSTAIPISQHHGSASSNHEQSNLTKLVISHEMQPVRCSIARVSLEMDY